MKRLKQKKIVALLAVAVADCGCWRVRVLDPGRLRPWLGDRWYDDRHHGQSGQHHTQQPVSRRSVGGPLGRLRQPEPRCSCHLVRHRDRVERDAASRQHPRAATASRTARRPISRSAARRPAAPFRLVSTRAARTRSHHLATEHRVQPGQLQERNRHHLVHGEPGRSSPLVEERLRPFLHLLHPFT